MKLIGIIGKSGSGKTTLSRMLQRDDDSIGVIHLDEVKANSIKPITNRMPKSFVKEYTNSIGEDFVIFNKKVMEILLTLKKNSFFNNIYEGVLKIPQENILKKQIKENEKAGKKCLILERCNLSKLFYI